MSLCREWGRRRRPACCCSRWDATAFPVDTHVHRVATRLGLIPPKTTAEQAHRLLLPGIAPELRYEFHMQLIKHGREVCKAARPLCNDCVLFDLCASGPELRCQGAGSLAGQGVLWDRVNGNRTLIPSLGGSLGTLINR